MIQSGKEEGSTVSQPAASAILGQRPLAMIYSLDPASEELWQAYLAAERTGARQVWKKALDQFVAALLAQGPSVADRWARALAERVVDGAEPQSVRFPLFREVLVPALVRGVQANEAGSARWLGCLMGRWAQNSNLLEALPEEMRTSRGLLLAALRLDAGDQRARRALVEEMAAYLAYTLHELPAGVLYGFDGATVEQCRDLTEMLSEFREQVRLLGESRYAELIADCEQHYTAYPKYLTSRAAHDTYAAFLARAGGP